MTVGSDWCCRCLLYETCYLCKENQAPNRLRVTIDGVLPSGCSCCGTRNRTYWLHYTGGNFCLWMCNFGCGSCDVGHLVALLLRSDDGHYYLTVSLYVNPLDTVAKWQLDLGTEEPDCTEWQNLELPFLSPSLLSSCKYSASTCIVDAVHCPECIDTMSSEFGYDPESAFCVDCYPVPRWLQLDVSEITNRTPLECLKCEDLNGSYVLPLVGPIVPYYELEPHCCLKYLYQFPSPICYFNKVVVLLCAPSYWIPSYAVRVSFWRGAEEFRGPGLVPIGPVDCAVMDYSWTETFHLPRCQAINVGYRVRTIG